MTTCYDCATDNCTGISASIECLFNNMKNYTPYEGPCQLCDGSLSVEFEGKIIECPECVPITAPKGRK